MTNQPDAVALAEVVALLSELLDGPSGGKFYGIDGTLWSKLETIRLAALRQPAPRADDALRAMDTAPKDGTYFLIVGTNFDGGAAVVQWDDRLEWWALDDGKNPEIMLRGESRLCGWLPLPDTIRAALASEEPTAAKGD